MKTAVIVFPGSNCDRDIAVALEQVTGRAPAMVWHRDSELPDGTDFIALPGGFSYGDYLRSGAMAARAPIMRRGHRGGGARRAADRHLQRLPGADRGRAAARRADAQCRPGVRLPAGRADGREQPEPVHRRLPGRRDDPVPVAHHDGNYQADEATLDRLEGEGRVALRYAEPVNGSARAIAGILNDAGNVLGLMPHPERAFEPAHGGTDGRRMFEGLLEAVANLSALKRRARASAALASSHKLGRPFGLAALHAGT